MTHLLEAGGVQEGVPALEGAPQGVVARVGGRPGPLAEAPEQRAGRVQALVQQQERPRCQHLAEVGQRRCRCGAAGEGVRQGYAAKERLACSHQLLVQDSGLKGS